MALAGSPHWWNYMPRGAGRSPMLIAAPATAWCCLARMAGAIATPTLHCLMNSSCARASPASRSRSTKIASLARMQSRPEASGWRSSIASTWMPAALPARCCARRCCKQAEQAHHDRATGAIVTPCRRLRRASALAEEKILMSDSAVLTASVHSGGARDRYRQVRAHTEALAAALTAEDQCLQSMPDASPAKWHRAHITWFFEQFVLVPLLPGYRVFDDAFQYLFNSYYEAVGPRHPRPMRGLLSRPSVADVARYRAHVDDAMHTLIDTCA